MFLFDYLSWEPINVLTAFHKDAEPMMAIEDRSILPDLQRTPLTGCK